MAADPTSVLPELDSDDGRPPGPLALVGGSEWSEGCSFDRDLWETAGRPEVLVLPTAAAYEHPGRAVAAAADWFGGWGAKVRGLDVLSRSDAERDDYAASVAGAAFIYLGGGSSLHLRSVLKDSKVWSAMVGAWHGGAVLAGAAAGAMALCDPMVDPRGGALTLGLGLIRHLAILPHTPSWSKEKSHRTVQLATGHLRIATVDERTALIRDPDGTWRAAGAGHVTVYVDGQPEGLEALSGR